MSRLIRNEAGEWRQGKSAGSLLREDLRRLPSELVTKDIENPDAIHEDDAPHVVEAIEHDYADAINNAKPESQKDALEKLTCAKPGEVVPLSQWEIDVVRMRIIAQRVNQMMAEAEAGGVPDFDIRHVWFPENNVNHYYLRRGNPPADCDRPKHMRRLKLAIDVTNIPEEIEKVLRDRGVPLWTPNDLINMQMQKGIVLL